MAAYLLFIDTEASGLPKNWNLPYSVNNNWPCAIQISWVICTDDGKKVKEESRYIAESDIVISPSSYEVHGLTQTFLQDYGVSRREALAVLAADLETYRPTIVGHFAELDFHIIGADFYRAGLPNPMLDLPSYCTMLATTHLVANPQTRFFKLGELYQLLFNEPLLDQHNALTDATATAAVYFELLNRKQISASPQPPIALPKKTPLITGMGWGVVALVIILIILLISFYI